MHKAAAAPRKSRRRRGYPRFPPASHPPLPSLANTGHLHSGRHTLDSSRVRPRDTDNRQQKLPSSLANSPHRSEEWQVEMTLPPFYVSSSSSWPRFGQVVTEMGHKKKHATHITTTKTNQRDKKIAPEQSIFTPTDNMYVATDTHQNKRGVLLLCAAILLVRPPPSRAKQHKNTRYERSHPLLSRTIFISSSCGHEPKFFQKNIRVSIVDRSSSFVLWE